MKLKDIKYLFSYILPAIYLTSLAIDGLPLVSTTVMAFVILPIIDQFSPQDWSNVTPEEEEARDLVIFDLLLYLNVVLVGYIIFATYQYLSIQTLSIGEQVGLMTSLGTLLSAHGINVAHELGHREDRLAQIGAKLLLLPCLDLHFTLEHNYGHHVYVSTPEDPTTARKGEWIFAFWFRAMLGSYANAWKLEDRFIKRTERSILSHRIAWYTLIYFVYGGVLVYLLGSYAWILLGGGVMAMLLLQSINYIEHYGITRQQTSGGKYEPVQPWHSWNSNHVIGRIVLYELTRHSDHHYKANRKYQNLRSMQNAPLLPLGYPASILMAMVPPLWFRVIDKRYAEYLETNELG